MKNIPNFDKRVKEASIDPFYKLAQELIKEGFSEKDVWERTKKFSIPDPQRVKLLNFMRDIERGLGFTHY